MEIPQEFKAFTRFFWQGSDEEVSEEKEWIANALRLTNTQQRAVVKRFLDELLTSNADGKELQRIWASGAPSYDIPNDAELRYFLTLVRDMIE